MKIGVISDTHIPIACDELPAAVKKHFHGVDMILHAGDLVDIKVVSMLEEICPVVHAVCGNMDSHPSSNHLPQKLVVTAGKYKIGLTHGWGAPEGIIDRIKNEFKNVDAVVFGHTHKAVCEKRGGVLFFNPGSATDKFYAEENTIGILEVNGGLQGTIIRI